MAEIKQPKLCEPCPAVKATSLGPPEIVGKKLRVAIEGEESKMSDLLARFDKHNLPILYCQASRARPKS